MLVDGPVALAVRRLSIIDLEGGDQPIGNEDGRVHVVQNGEIYNHRRAARASSSGAATGSRPAATPRCSCTSTRSAGPDFVEQLRGMFAIALWDRRERRLRAGPRPVRDQAALLRAPATARLSFASELKALLRQPGFSREVDLDALRGVSGLQLDPGAADDLPRRRASSRRATC